MNRGGNSVSEQRERRRSSRRIWMVLPVTIISIVAFVLVVLSGLFGAVALGAISVFLGAAVLVGLGAVAWKFCAVYGRRQDYLNTELRNLKHRLADSQAQAEALEKQLQSDRESQIFSLRAMRRDLQVLRRRVPAGFLDDVDSKVADLDDVARATLRIAFESAIRFGRNPRDMMSSEQANLLFNDYLSRRELLKLRPLIEHFGLLEVQNLTNLRLLYRYYRKIGYWDLAIRAIDRVSELTQSKSDIWAGTKLRHEAQVFARPTLIQPVLPGGNAYNPSGPILHMVGRVLPETQTGYTLRTHYTAMAQQRKGLPVAIVGQTGITSERSETCVKYNHSGIDYYLLPGNAKSEVLLDEWLRENIERLADLVLQVRPSILHAHSDFFNALIVTAVGNFYGIPTVYESRGFWEESWLSRTVTAEGWGSDQSNLFEAYGLPSAYVLRRDAEALARELTDHVFTLADVMRNHILESGHVDSTSVSIVPNAVEAEEFPVQIRDEDLAAEVGIETDTVTIGYISSIVEYEGIDTLIDAFELLTTSMQRKANLLLVGDGDYLDTLKRQVDSRNISNVIFTGRVAHDSILKYYGLIDIFVIPRKKSKVTDLVTPLKPFEAFCTGRTVVVSDVTALQEIADQSGSTEVFIAGSATDLARKLMRLMDSPDRCDELSDRGAGWVRNHRSWARNVNEYYRVYRSLGYTGPANDSVEAETRLEDMGKNAGELLDEMSESKLPPLRGWFSLSAPKQSATDILNEGWVFDDFAPIKLPEIDDWSEYGRVNRSWGFTLHAWDFMDAFLLEFDRTGEAAWLSTGIGIAKKWIDRYGACGSSDPMAWYDMSIALRAPRLLALALRSAREATLRSDALILAEGLSRHINALHDEKTFNPNNNHGVFTAASQVHLAKYAWMLPGAQEAGSEGAARLKRMAQSQFSADGIHLEHSPEYHRMLLASFEALLEDGLIQDQDIRNRLLRAAGALGWMVQPDGCLVQMGDTPQVRMTKGDAHSVDAETQYILSETRTGTRATNELAVYSEGGYAFVRSPQPSNSRDFASGSYLAFSAAFHSRAHKHADDLNVVWFDRGQQILTDAGRYGYGKLLDANSARRKQGFYYADNERQFVEGTMAHNTLMMDGVDQDRRKRKPFGSALGECSAEGGVFDLSGRVHHLDYIHRRRVIFRPGSELIFKDSVYSQFPDNREGIIWFNLSGGFALESVGESLEFSKPSNEGRLHLTIVSEGQLLDEPVYGRTDPIRGWSSQRDRELVPVWSLGFRVSVDTRASIETRLNLDLR